MKAINNIIADIRDLAANRDWHNHTNQSNRERLLDIANSIEQAVTNCNQLKMREALVMIQKEAVEISRKYTAPMVDIVAMTCDALVAKPRNCDLYTTEAEAHNAFIAWYNTTYDLNGDKWNEVSSCELKHNVDDILHDYINWLFAEAKGE